MKFRPGSWLCVFVLTAVLACSKSADKPMFFLAASLAEVASDWQAAYDNGFDHHTGASLLLTQQIRGGARADLFLAAGLSAIAPLQEEGKLALVDSVYLRNCLVLICAPGVVLPTALEDLRDPRFARIAVADPELAPAGGYARTGLKKAGLWDELTPRFIFTGDVRMAAETIRLATADAAFVYATDAASLNLEAITLDSALFPPVAYPLVMLSPRTVPKDELWEFLHTPQARELAAARGFK